MWCKYLATGAPFLFPFPPGVAWPAWPAIYSGAGYVNDRGPGTITSNPYKPQPATVVWGQKVREHCIDRAQKGLIAHRQCAWSNSTICIQIVFSIDIPHQIYRSTAHRAHTTMDSDVALIDPALSAHSSQTLPAKPPRHIHFDDDNNNNNNNKDNNDDDDDDDPIVATYQVLMKPSQHAQQTLKILEAPNKIDPKKDRVPLELRTKPGTGMFEVDFPLDHSAAYDREKGLNWGTALQKSTEAKKGGSHGLAGGFGVGAPPARAPRGGGGRGADGIDYGMEWNEALRRDMVLRTQTLGGQTPDAGAESAYMVAVFAGGTYTASLLSHIPPTPLSQYAGPTNR